MDKWEYHILRVDYEFQLKQPAFEEALNNFGYEGWEAVSMVSNDSGMHGVLMKRRIAPDLKLE